MQQLPEQIYNQSLARLAAGESLESIINSLPKNTQSQELKAELALSQLLLSLPKNFAPLPVKRFAFKEKKPFANFFTAHWRSLIFAPLTILLLVSLGFGANLASRATAGQKLFAVKKAYEKTQLALTTNPEEKAALQLKLSQRRLAEAESVLYGPIRSPEREAAVLAELSKQTQTAAEAVKLSQDNGNIAPDTVASLESISQEIASLSQPENLAAAAPSSTTASKVADLKKILSAAKEAGITTLEPTPVTISVSGNIQNIQDNIIYLEQYPWETSSNTQYYKGTTRADFNALSKGVHVTLTGEKRNEHFYAIKITVTQKEEKSTAPEKPTSKPASTSVPTSTPVMPEPAKVMTRIIVEDPSPQYTP